MVTFGGSKAKLVLFSHLISVKRKHPNPKVGKSSKEETLPVWTESTYAQLVVYETPLSRTAFFKYKGNCFSSYMVHRCHLRKPPLRKQLVLPIQRGCDHSWSFMYSSLYSNASAHPRVCIACARRSLPFVPSPVAKRRMLVQTLSNPTLVQIECWYKPACLRSS